MSSILNRVNSQILSRFSINFKHSLSYESQLSGIYRISNNNLNTWFDKMKRGGRQNDSIKPDLKKSSTSTTSTEDWSKPRDVNFGFGETKKLDEAGFKQFLETIKRNKQECGSIREFPYNENRTRLINGVKINPKKDYRGVTFWMFRDQRVDDNWALICAQKFALEHKCPLYVTFFLMSHYSVAGTRQYDFMLNGLQQVEKQCQKLGIQFHLRLGYAKDLIVDYCDDNEIDLVVCDFCPLRDPTNWVEEAGRKLKKVDIPLYQVDAHNIVPVWITSNKQEFAAATIRPKIHNHMREYLTEIPSLDKHPYQPECKAEPVNWEEAWDSLNIDTTVPPVAWAKPGTLNGYRMIYEFITQRLQRYDEERNLPTKHALSCLSPYYHFGQLSVQRAILAVATKELRKKYTKSVDAFVEETVVRRELADNFCFYQPNYDNLEGASDWAKKSIAEHRKDKREYIYSQEELQFGKTHDEVWNAAQIQLLQEGKMHGYLRMYWAKKILEWTPDVEEALRVGFLLNDKYELDGRDPNGYVGVMWSMCGTHDRPFVERPIFGKLRYMNYNGCKRKFDIKFLAHTYNEFK